jgi:hypothetical protein
MYYALLTIHSLFRWLVLLSVVYSIIHSYRGYKSNRIFNKRDNLLRHSTATIAHVQMSLGLWLYFISPFVTQFFSDMSSGVHLREIRFFAMEHSLMMLVAVIVITIGSMKAKRQVNDTLKFKTIYVWYLIALIIILLNIPWEFSPLVNRPSLRWF